MSSQTIVMNARDHVRLEEIVQRNSQRRNGQDRTAFEKLAGELARAIIVQPDEIPPDIATMSSTVSVRDLDSGEILQLTISWPDEADPQEYRINVLAPLGMALLGVRVGEEVEWDMPSGVRRLRIEQVLFQPEAIEKAGGKR